MFLGTTQCENSLSSVCTCAAAKTVCGHNSSCVCEMFYLRLSDDVFEGLEIHFIDRALFSGVAVRTCDQ